MKRSSKIVIVAALVLAVAVVAALWALWTNLDDIVKAAIERYGSQATQTAVAVSRVKVRLEAGEASVVGLTVANPPGFSSPDVFRLGSISVKLEPRSVVSGPLVLDEVRVSAPDVVYEMDPSGRSNIGVLQKNIASPSKEPRERPSKTGTKSAKELRLRVKKLVIENGKVDVRVAALGGKRETLSLRRIEMSDIGGNSGAAPEDVANRVVAALIDEAAREVAQAGAERYFKKGFDRAVRRLLDSGQ